MYRPQRNSFEAPEYPPRRRGLLAIVLVAAILFYLLIRVAGGSEPTAAICKIQVDSAGGSGALIAASGSVGYVLTCEHVAQINDLATCTFPDGSRSRGFVTSTDTKSDLALIRIIAPPSITPINVAPIEDYPRVGQIVHAYGYGTDRRLVTVASKVNGYKFGNRMSWSVGSQSGDSGGPVLNDRGELTAVIQGGELASRYGPSIDSHGPSITAIHKFLRNCPSGNCPLIGRRQPVTIPPAQTQPPPPPSIQPPIPPVVPGQPAPADIDYERLADLIAARITVIEGKPGPPGPGGKDGRDGQSPTIDLAALTESVRQQLPPVVVEIIRPDGSTATQSKPLGQPIRLKLVPVN